jgi:hypothetical protein
MKRLFFLFLFITTTALAQSNLVFEEPLWIPIGPSPGGAVVPTGKVWKIQAVSIDYFFIDGVQLSVRNNNGVGNLPLWLPEGKTITASSNQYLSVLQLMVLSIIQINEK